MARLMDADNRIAEIKNQYCTGCDNYGGVRCRACWVDDAICLIDDATTVDAVEVVRCEFCKNAEPYDCTFHGTVHHLYKCKKDEGVIGYNKVVLINDFCSYGERKDGDWNG